MFHSVLRSHVYVKNMIEILFTVYLNVILNNHFELFFTNEKTNCYYFENQNYITNPAMHIN